MDQRFESPLRLVPTARQTDQVMGAVAPDFHHRVIDQMHSQTLAIDLHRDRIDQKRHVIINDFNDRVGRLPAMFIGPRVIDAQLRCATGKGACKLPMRKRRAIQIGHRLRGEVFGRLLSVILAREFGCFGRLGFGQLAVNQSNQRVDGVGWRR